MASHVGQVAMHQNGGRPKMSSGEMRTTGTLAGASGEAEEFAGASGVAGLGTDIPAHE